MNMCWVQALMIRSETQLSDPWAKLLVLALGLLFLGKQEAVEATVEVQDRMMMNCLCNHLRMLLGQERGPPPTSGLHNAAQQSGSHKDIGIILLSCEMQHAHVILLELHHHCSWLVWFVAVSMCLHRQSVPGRPFVAHISAIGMHRHCAGRYSA